MLADGQTALNKLQLLKLCNKAKHSLSPALTDGISSTHHMKKMTQIWEHIAGKQMMGYVPEHWKSQYYFNGLQSSETDVASYEIE